MDDGWNQDIDNDDLELDSFLDSELKSVGLEDASSENDVKVSRVYMRYEVASSPPVSSRVSSDQCFKSLLQDASFVLTTFPARAHVKLC